MPQLLFPHDRYEHLLQAGILTPDPAQMPIIERLQILAAALSRPRRRWHRAEPPRGLYIYGPVGRGKSMLMDLFFETASVEAKRRVHFNAFMLEVHRRLHQARGHETEPLRKVAMALAQEIRLLCFDEFQVSDIADAMILGRLFTLLLDHGVIIVATSNTPPPDLYRDGLQRSLFMPFIALLQQRLDIVEIGAGVDHRLSKLAGRSVYFTPDDTTATQALDALFAAMTGGAAMAPATVDAGGRSVSVPLVAGHVARMSFAALCQSPLGAEDYLALAERFPLLIVDHVPRFDPAARNEALRFITLIDQLYEKHTCLAMSAAAEPQALYPSDGPLAGAFQRTVSRLMEMQSQDYLSDSVKN